VFPESTPQLPTVPLREAADPLRVAPVHMFVPAMNRAYHEFLPIDARYAGSVDGAEDPAFNTPIRPSTPIATDHPLPIGS
jgi:hypothetical protein